MIELIKYSAISFHLKINIQGIVEMLEYIKQLESKKEKHLQILYLEKIRSFEIKTDNNMSKMLIEEGFVKMYMESEEIEYLELRLKEALISKCFYPSEICELKYKNRYITVYCDVS